MALFNLCSDTAVLSITQSSGHQSKQFSAAWSEWSLRTGAIAWTHCRTKPLRLLQGWREDKTDANVLKGKPRLYLEEQFM